MRISLKPRYRFVVPILGENICPDVIADRSLREIRELEAWEGNRKRALSELFVIKRQLRISKEPSITIYGDVIKVREIGARMSFGTIRIEGDAGLYLGREMSGGRIIVKGNAGSWVGSRMKGGTISVRGNAGDYVGSPYRGSRLGMSGGVISVQGNAGIEVGGFMRGGTIRIDGDVGQFVGVRMRGGTVIVQGRCEGRMGASMRDGTIIINGEVPSVLPSFSIEGVRDEVKINGETVVGPFLLFTGDVAEGGHGRLYVSANRNPHLRFYEGFLK
ncbi:MAG: formylmethanofuran dehydrogenase subunit C [Candidatus Bathyarchaeia archaeon]